METESIDEKKSKRSKPKHRRVRPKVGSLLLKHGAWHWRYYADGKQHSEKLAPYSDMFCLPGDVVHLANERASHMQPDLSQPACGSMLITDFIDKHYYPWIQETKRPATVEGYRKLLATLRPHIANKRLRDLQPHHASAFLTDLVKKGWGRNSVNHMRSVMSRLAGLSSHLQS